MFSKLSEDMIMHTVSDQGGIKGRLPESEQANDVGPENHQGGEASAADPSHPVMVQKGVAIPKPKDTPQPATEGADADTNTSRSGNIPAEITGSDTGNGPAASEPKVVVRGATASQTSANTSSLANTGSSTIVASDIDLLRLQANQGDPAAQAQLAAKYFNGDGIELDLEQAVYWYKKAAEQGHAGAQSQLGECYFKGEGVKEDKRLAFYWFDKAAEQGHADAQIFLAAMYRNGLGVPQDLKRAAYWCTKAAEQGDQDAQSVLGVLYEKGEGVEQNFEQAVYWQLRSNLKLVAKRKNFIFSDYGVDSVLKCLPNVLKKYPEFSGPKKIALRYFKFSDAGLNVLDQLVRFDPSIEKLVIKIDQTCGAEKINAWIEQLITALREQNTWLTRLKFERNSWLLVPKSDLIDDDLRTTLNQLLEQNKLIGKLRQYASKHPAASSYALPLEVLSQVVDKLIVHRIRRGDSEAATQAAVDEFLMGAQFNLLQAGAAQPKTD
jgi:hypothetical protein